MTCKKCNNTMSPSKAFKNTWITHLDFIGQTNLRGCTMSRSGAAKLVDVLKCISCGYSIEN